MHAQTKQWQSVAHSDPLLASLGEEQDARVARALAPARGALMGMLFGAVCWGLVATAVWVAL